MKAKSDLAILNAFSKREVRLLIILMSKYYVYLLLSLKDRKFYVGSTTDLIKRLREHENAEVTSTKNRRPLKLIHYEYFINKVDAKSREVFLKSGFGRDQLRQSLKRTLIQFLRPPA
jgi:putative endonuclease